MARRRSGKKIDFTHWTYQSFSVAAVAAGTIGATFLAAQHEPETWLRFRGTELGYVDGAQVPGGRISIGVGLIPVPEGTGSTVLWSPISDGDAPWIWASYFELGYEEMVTDVIDVPGATSFRSVIDSKSMRILRNQEVQFVLENATLSSAMSVNYSMSGRILSGT